MNQAVLDFVNTLDATFQRLLKNVSSASGVPHLTVSQLQYIDAIHTLYEPTVTELAAKLGVSKPSVTVGISKLVQRGYARRTSSEEDKRVVRLSLTEAGNELAEAKARALRDYVDFMHKALTEEEAEQFEAIVTKLVKRFEQA